MKKRTPKTHSLPSTSYSLPSAIYPLSSILYSLSLATLVSAGPVEALEDLLSGLSGIIAILIKFLSDTFLDINQVDELLFAKLIFLVLIFLIVYVAVDKNDFFGGNKTISRIIAAAISILSVRYIPDQLIQVIFLQYGALGSAIGMFIPFMIMLFFLHQSGFGPLPRRIGWIFYGISYLAIFAYTYQDLSGIAGYIYWAGLLAIIIAFLFDRKIHVAFGSIEMRKTRAAYSKERYIYLNKELGDAHKQLSREKDAFTRRLLEEKVKDLEEKVKDARKDI